MIYKLQVDFVDETKGCGIGQECEPLPSGDFLTDAGTPQWGKLYRYCVREYGHCKSNVYIDTPTGTKRVGWYFVKRCLYTGTNKPYLRGAWVSVVEFEPERRKYVPMEGSHGPAKRGR